MAGLVLTLAFPPWNLFWLAWLIPGVLPLVSLQASSGKRFLCGFFFGLAHALTGSFWILNVPVPVLALVSWTGIGLIQGTLFGAWTWIAGRLVSVRDRKTDARTQIFRGREAIFIAAAWVSMELIGGRVAIQVPYSIAYTQWKFPFLVRISSWTGPYGVSFLMVWFSIEFWQLLLTWKQRAASEKTRLCLPLLATLLAGWATSHPVAKPDATAGILPVALVQPALVHRQPWTEVEKTNEFRRLISTVEREVPPGTGLIVLPEDPIPNFFTSYTWLTYSTITNLVQSLNCAMLFGGSDLGPAERAGEGNRRYNSAFLADASGRLAGVYHKRHLVPGGEYIPGAGHIPFLRRWLRLDQAFAPGTKPGLFHLNSFRCSFAVLICAEDLYPHEVRQSVTDQTSFIVNLTNDSWFGESGAQWIHMAGSIYRAAENGVSVLRCANNGITCWIDPGGTIRGRISRPTPYSAGVLRVEVPIQPPGHTFYNAAGDFFGWACVFLVCLRSLTVWMSKKAARRLVSRGSKA